MDSLPYTNPTGREYPSLIRIEESSLLVEFRKWVWRKLSKQIVQVRIPMEEVTSIDLKRGVFVDQINMQLRSMRAAGAIPCRKPGLIEMRFARKHREAAHDLATVLRTAVSEQHIDRLDREIRRLED